MTDLPNEILLEIFQHTEKRDLKSVRLVNKQWSYSSVDHLFTKVFVSLHRLNLEVFEKITQHPIFRTTVRTLEYDTIYFSPTLTLLEYARTMCDDELKHIRNYEGIGPSHDDSNRFFAHPQFHKLSRLLTEWEQQSLDLPTRTAKLAETPFLQRGIRSIWNMLIFKSNVLTRTSLMF